MIYRTREAQPQSQNEWIKLPFAFGVFHAVALGCLWRNFWQRSAISNTHCGVTISLVVLLKDLKQNLAVGIIYNVAIFSHGLQASSASYGKNTMFHIECWKALQVWLIMWCLIVRTLQPSCQHKVTWMNSCHGGREGGLLGGGGQLRRKLKMVGRIKYKQFLKYMLLFTHIFFLRIELFWILWKGKILLLGGGGGKEAYILKELVKNVLAK